MKYDYQEYSFNQERRLIYEIMSVLDMKNQLHYYDIISSRASPVQISLKSEVLSRMGLRHSYLCERSSLVYFVEPHLIHSKTNRFFRKMEI